MDSVYQSFLRKVAFVLIVNGIGLYEDLQTLMGFSSSHTSASDIKLPSREKVVKLIMHRV